ncbi:hypothetical protein MKX54_03515 [Alkalihalobacillus sp. FSL R5-0424]
MSSYIICCDEKELEGKTVTHLSIDKNGKEIHVKDEESALIADMLGYILLDCIKKTYINSRIEQVFLEFKIQTDSKINYASIRGNEIIYLG